MKNRKPNRLPGYDFSKDNLYFVTLCVKNMICCFGEVVGKAPGAIVRASRDLPTHEKHMVLNAYGKIAHALALAGRSIPLRGAT